MRKYRGFYDNGQNVCEIEYYSDYKNRSKKNMEDMKKEYIKKYGYNQSKYVKFIFGYLLEDEV